MRCEDLNTAKTDDTLSRPQQLDLESVHSITERIEDEGLKDLLRCMAKVIDSQRRRIAKVEESLTLTETATDELGHIVTDFITRTKTQIDDFLRINITPEEALEDWYRRRA